ncbi:cytochrome c [Stieleria varia]|uniref:Cytochrome c n=1 Tax=Stieleria varia TaxID=2528005 RepID=A0A5C6A5J6_9BACT|nr:c-type cytochrome [Stieleria varia]TWT94578.1 Cytochrome c [Stieleria varia]
MPRCRHVYQIVCQTVYRAVFLLSIGCLLAGCDKPLADYPANELHALVLSTSRSAPSQRLVPDTQAVMRPLFGTAKQPHWPVERMSDAAAGLIDPESLVRAAGQVSSDEAGKHYGLMVEHCVVCHGLNGGGNGPAALLQKPYPRDFRPGVFKWKSTTRASKPTREDLARLLKHGVPGTAMPSFALLAPEDRDALVDYAIFLSIRGEVERRLMAVAIDELGYGDDDSSMPDSDRLSDPSNADLVDAVIQRVTNDWLTADENVVEVPTETPNDAASISRGRELFHGQVANCAGCHGPGGNGQMVTIDYDDWTKEFTTKLGLTPTDKEAIRPFRKAGALRPSTIQPRQLSNGVFHGGGDSETLYRRITQGIAGTPMPGVIVSETETPTGLTASQVWDLVHYVLSLSNSVTEDHPSHAEPSPALETST